jgi:HSP20 family protein
MATATAPVPAPAKQAPTTAPATRSTHPFELMRHFAQEMDRVFGDFGLRSRWPFTSIAETESALWAPDLEVTQDQSKLQVRLDLPGLKKDDVKVEITDEALIVQGERRQEEEKKDKGYYRTERSYGRFYRSVALPEGVRPESAKATFADGVLEIAMDVNAPQPAAGRRLEIAEPAKNT